MKVYKYNNKLIIYLPLDVAKELKLDENDEIDFFKYNDKAFLFTKKSDITKLLTASPETIKEKPVPKDKDAPSEEELAVLKKLDTLRYPQRTVENVNKILNSGEREILQQLTKKKMVSLFKDNKSGVNLYSISKQVYDRFLMRKKQNKEQQVPVIQQPKRSALGFVSRDNLKNENVKSLEKDGFLVLQSEAEAASVSIALEESIRRGFVIGTRSFNKKFYIVTRNFFDTNCSNILRLLKSGKSRTAEVAEAIHIPEEGARAILSLLAEAGDIRERRKDFFLPA